jgi:hypothetical protein
MKYPAREPFKTRLSKIGFSLENFKNWKFNRRKFCEKKVCNNLHIVVFSKKYAVNLNEKESLLKQYDSFNICYIF